MTTPITLTYQGLLAARRDKLNTADVPPALGVGREPPVTAAFAKRLERVEAHRAELVDILGDLDVVADGDALYAALRDGTSAVVYLYCHGGVSEDGPAFVEIGDAEDPYVTGEDLELLKVRERRGLVFINGCRTSAVSPRERFNLVSAFVRYAKVAAVIGTEITVFEPMASMFGTAFINAFVLDGQSLGESIRRARLALLQRRNPHGLVYVPFGLAGLKLQRAAIA